MGKYIISTDSASDLPEEYLKEHGVICAPLYYLVDGVAYGEEKKLAPKEFYDIMRQGNMPTTSGSTPDEIKKYLRPYLEQGYDILHLAFSSALSSTCQNAFLAGKELEEEFPDRKIIVLDTKCASLGEGFLVHKCVEMRDKGMELEALAQWAEDHIQNTIHLFTVDNLDALYRGGRVSKATAVVAGLVNLKPVLHVDEKGALIPLKTVRGRKKSLTTMIDMMCENIRDCDIENDIFFISHSDCGDEAQEMAETIKAKTGIKNCLISYIGPTIGAHTGPGCIALFFFGKAR